LKRKIITIGATTALAAGTAVMAAPTASAVGWCHGNEVRTCIYIDIDGDRARAAGRITDVEGGRDFQVKILNLRLQLWSGSTWVNVKQSGDHDTWKPFRDTAITDWYTCGGHQNRKFRAIAYYRWEHNGNVGDGEQATSPRVVDCRR
jgi:hypothetical protein